jgi:predicted phosphodiesterase
MRVGLLSDVHANLPALQAVLARIDATAHADALWVTGDTVGYGADPSEVLALLRERGAVLVQGNHDRAVATGEGLDWFHDRAAVAVRLHTKWLSGEERDFLGGLPLTATIERFTLCHGSVRDPLWEYVTSASAAAASLAQATTPFACRPARACLIRSRRARCSIPAASASRATVTRVPRTRCWTRWPEPRPSIARRTRSMKRNAASARAASRRCSPSVLR